VLLSADNLGAHSVFGFLESFSSKKFCRLCEGDRDCIEWIEAAYTMRTPQSFDAAVASIGSEGYNRSLTGIKSACILNEIPSFHVTKNYALDAMHDLLEGVVPFELQLVLPALIKKKYVSDGDIQSAINNFTYSSSDETSKPPFTSANNIRVSAAEAWCLIRCLPLILGSKIPRTDPHWEVITLLCEIVDIVFAPRYSEGLCQYLAYLIEEHHTKLQQLFPDIRLLPKHHFLIHYPTCMLLSGPPSQYWCMRFEARHSFFKQAARVNRCFKNICKSLAKRAQLSLASAIMRRRIFSEKRDVGACEENLVGSLPHEVAVVLQDSGLSPCDTVGVLKWVSIGHYKISAGSVVVSGVRSEYPEFAQVKAAIHIAGKVQLILQKFSTRHFDRHFRAYAVEHTAQHVNMSPDSLTDVHPTNLHTVSVDGSSTHFVQTRYLVL